ncbi:MAG: hypothetical protein KatS3mg081_2926 [Gemmatimonadales bacterium]|nr:MAG: hypothetical protein KatS3mg081_2926 [Gemmatimonadales bacterium]
MHELSIALEVARLVEEAVGPERVPRVVRVGLEVGTDAGVEIPNLEFCLQALLSTSPFSGAEPEIVECGGGDLRVTYLELEE